MDNNKMNVNDETVSKNQEFSPPLPKTMQTQINSKSFFVPSALKIKQE